MLLIVSGIVVLSARRALARSDARSRLRWNPHTRERDYVVIGSVAILLGLFLLLLMTFGSSDVPSGSVATDESSCWRDVFGVFALGGLGAYALLGRRRIAEQARTEIRNTVLYARMLALIGVLFLLGALILLSSVPEHCLAR